MFYYVLLFKAKQRFAYLLLIQSVYLFLNVLFLFQSVFHFFKCFRFTIETIRYQSFIIEELVLSLTSQRPKKTRLRLCQIGWRITITKDERQEHSSIMMTKPGQPNQRDLWSKIIGPLSWKVHSRVTESFVGIENYTLEQRHGSEMFCFCKLIYTDLLLENAKTYLMA